MSMELAAAISTMPVGFKYCILSDGEIITSIAKELGDRVIPIIGSSEITYFYILDTITVPHNDSEIIMKSFGKRPSIILGAPTLDIINSFLNRFKKESVPEDNGTPIPAIGYLQFSTKSSLKDEGQLITTGARFSDLVGIQDKVEEVTSKITSYFDNIEKYRILRLNKGINVILHGPPGSGKTVFARAIAHHYRSNLFIPEESYFSDFQSQLNPSTNNNRLNIVLLDNFSGRKEIKEYLPYIHDCASEDTIRIFTVEDINTLNKGSFLRYFHIVLEFKLPTDNIISQLVTRTLDCSAEDAQTLATLISTQETEGYNEYLVKYKDVKEEKRPKYKSFGYQGINMFLIKYIGVPNGVKAAINDLKSLIKPVVDDNTECEININEIVIKDELPSPKTSSWIPGKKSKELTALLEDEKKTENDLQNNLSEIREKLENLRDRHLHLEEMDNKSEGNSGDSGCNIM